MIRGKHSLAGLIHHCDRGSIYAADKYQGKLWGFGIKASMSVKGNCHDNASMESFYGCYKCSFVRGRIFENETELRANVFENIKIFYNRFRNPVSKA